MHMTLLLLYYLTVTHIESRRPGVNQEKRYNSQEVPLRPTLRNVWRKLVDRNSICVMKDLKALFSDEGYKLSKEKRAGSVSGRSLTDSWEHHVVNEKRDGQKIVVLLNTVVSEALAALNALVFLVDATEIREEDKLFIHFPWRALMQKTKALGIFQLSYKQGKASKVSLDGDIKWVSRQTIVDLAQSKVFQKAHGKALLGMCHFRVQEYKRGVKSWIWVTIHVSVALFHLFRLNLFRIGLDMPGISR